MIMPVPRRTESEEEQTISRLRSIVIELLLKNEQLRRHASKLSNHAESNVLTQEALSPPHPLMSQWKHQVTEEVNGSVMEFQSVKHAV